MKKETTTIAKKIGNCPICGYPIYEDLVHHCPTAPKTKEWKKDNKFEENKFNQNSN